MTSLCTRHPSYYLSPEMRSSTKMPPGRTLQLLATLLLVTAAMAAESIPTYEWTDETGSAVLCQKCAPGTFVAKHCSSTSNTLCQECPEEHYAQYWNYLDKCRFCNVICQEGEQVQHECNSTHNRVCECQPGYQRRNHYCVREPQCNFQDVRGKDNEECDNLVIKYIVSLNITDAALRRLEHNLGNHKGKKHVSEKRVWNLLKEFKENNPDRPLLLQLLQSLKKNKMNKLEKMVRQKFLEPEEP